ncbi:helix-turn-helix domain-containing protein [Streptomyces sp. ADI93-02]|uniref:winged helix-turn-helix transcriptional regulator n=1 Tax=Streptomyces sp. ADI93-02 TaxID=1522757 RepID=UPI000FB358EB|nr:helix-turn-helix domain-containing protein [Streptomyces sp. ADI93-02]RPK53242.1 putative HTH-type transcriptional regulator YybR [Streptomyces sp. ADI93-02]
MVTGPGRGLLDERAVGGGVRHPEGRGRGGVKAGGPRDDGCGRHGELVGLIGGISRKVLTQTLRKLQGYGLVERHVYEDARVEYSLTELGRTLVVPIAALTEWADRHGEAVVDFQESQRDGADGH